MSEFILSIEEWHSILSRVVDTRSSIIFRLIYYLGCSEKDLIEIKKRNIDFKNQMLRLSSRSSIIPPKLNSDLKDFTSEMKRDDYILQGRDGKTISAKRIQQLVTQSSEDAGYRVTPQDIRFIHIAHALMKDISPSSIRRQVGVSYQRIAQVMDKIKNRLEDKCYMYEL